MKKSTITIIVIIILVAIAITVYATMSGSQAPIPNTPAQVGATVTRSGTVVEVNKDAAMYDGPIRIVIQGADSTRTTIAIPSMGLPLCAAYKTGAIKDPYNIVVGSTLEVSGTLGEDGSVVPCQSDMHYLR